VARADFLRAEKSRFNSVTSCAKVSVDDVESFCKVSADVLKPTPPRLNLSDESEDFRPEVAWVFCPKPLSGLREGLTGIAANDSIHKATPRTAIEGS
jgi:hypothetical protein